MDHNNVGPVSQRASVRRIGVTFTGTNALRRAANIILQDLSFSTGAQAAAQNILRESEEGNARSVPPAVYSDASLFTSQWTVYSGLYSDSEDESAAPEDNLIVPETVRTQRSASTPPADRSRAPEGRRRHDNLARRLGWSPSSERGTTEGALLYPTEAFNDGFLRCRDEARVRSEGRDHRGPGQRNNEMDGGATQRGVGGDE
jgi:hypothetical protein